MRAIVFSAVFALGSLWVTGAVLACSIGPYEDPKLVADNADVIFIGKAVRSHWDITKAGDGPEELVKTTFQVRKVLKGEPGEEIQMNHLFPILGNCGTLFAPGQTVLVLATCKKDQCGTDGIIMGRHFSEEKRAELLSLLNVEEPKPFADETSQ